MNVNPTLIPLRMRQSLKYLIPGLVLALNVLSVFAQAPQWSWVKHATSSNRERVTDVANDPVNDGVFAVGYWQTDLSADLPGLMPPYGNEDGFVAKYNQDGTVAWAFSLGSNGNDQCYAVATDDSGYVYVTGFFTGTAQFRGVPSSPTANLTSLGNEDVFIARYDNNGNLKWVTQGQSSNEAIGWAIHADADGVFVTGGTRDSISFGGPNLPYLNGMDAWAVKLDRISGNLVWSGTGLGNGNNERGLGIDADGSDVYIVGLFASPTVTFDGNGATTLNNPTSGFRDIYVSKRDKSNGNVQWTQRIGGSDGEEAHGIALDNNGIFITGGCDDNNTSVSFPGFPPVNTGNSGEDIFVCRMDKATGNTIWVNVEQNNVNDDCRGDAVVFDGNNSIYVTGNMHGTTTFNAGPGAVNFASIGNDDIFVSAYDATTGSFLWAKDAGSSGEDMGWGLDTSRTNALYLGGYYANVSTFDTIPQLPNNGSDNIWVGRIGDLHLFARVDSVCVPFQTTLDIDVLANDANPSNSPLTTSILTSPTQGSASVQNNDSIRYVPAPGFTGLDSIRYQVCDTAGYCDQAWVYLRVFPFANAGSDVQLCVDNANINGNNPAPGNGMWQLVSGTGSIAAPTISTQPYPD